MKNNAKSFVSPNKNCNFAANLSNYTENIVDEE